MEINMNIKLKINKKMMLEKPSATISITDPMTSIQRKFYNAFLYIAKEALKKDPNKSEFEIPLVDLKKFFNIDDKKNTYLKEKIKELMRLITEYNILGKDYERWGAFTLLPYVDIYIDETGKGIVKFDIPIPVKKAILNKKKNFFAKIDLIIIRGLKSKYAIILYELLKDYEDVEIPEMDIDTFRRIFGVMDKYKIFPNLKNRVIEPAVKEINKSPNIDWEVDYTLKKIGPKYTHIKFIKKRKHFLNIKEQENQKKLDSNKIKAFISIIPEKYRTKSLEKYIVEIKDKYEPKYIEAQINYTNSKNPENYLAYLKTAIKEDYANYEMLKEINNAYYEKFKKIVKFLEKKYKEKDIEVDFKEYVRDNIFMLFNQEKITREEKDKFLEFWENLY